MTFVRKSIKCFESCDWILGLSRIWGPYPSTNDLGAGPCCAGPGWAGGTEEESSLSLDFFLSDRVSALRDIYLQHKKNMVLEQGVWEYKRIVIKFHSMVKFSSFIRHLYNQALFGGPGTHFIRQFTYESGTRHMKPTKYIR